MKIGFFWLISSVLGLQCETGDVINAFGDAYAGIMSNDQATINRVIKANDKYNEQVWQLPPVSEYCEGLKGKIGDIVNLPY